MDRFSPAALIYIASRADIRDGLNLAGRGFRSSFETSGTTGSMISGRAPGLLLTICFRLPHHPPSCPLPGFPLSFFCPDGEYVRQHIETAAFSLSLLSSSIAPACGPASQSWHYLSFSIWRLDVASERQTFFPSASKSLKKWSRPIQSRDITPAMTAPLSREVQPWLRRTALKPRRSPQNLRPKARRLQHPHPYTHLPKLFSSSIAVDGCRPRPPG